MKQEMSNRMKQQYLIDEFRTLKEELLKSIDPMITLQNGQEHRKKLSEAVKDSWERINHIQEKQKEQAELLAKIDERTLVLDDISKAIASYRDAKERIGKYAKPIAKGLMKIVIAIATTYIIIVAIKQLVEGKISLVEFIHKHII